MTQEQQHPIPPPPELVREWNQEATGTHFEPYGYSEFIANRAAQWGAGQELEALLVWLRVKGFNNLASNLLAVRRPKPPSLKEQALNDLDNIQTHDQEGRQIIDLSNIRLALEALPND